MLLQFTTGMLLQFMTLVIIYFTTGISIHDIITFHDRNVAKKKMSSEPSRAGNCGAWSQANLLASLGGIHK